jgi:hypothetical protein
MSSHFHKDTNNVRFSRIFFTQRNLTSWLSLQSPILSSNMRAFIQINEEGEFSNANCYAAYDGFRQLGWEIAKYRLVESIPSDDPEDVVVGGIGNVRSHLCRLGFEGAKQEMDYPEELRSYLVRKIWESTVEELVKDERLWNVFIKPKEETKKFTGKVVGSIGDFAGLVDHQNPTPIWVSEIVEFRAEWRCFVRYGEVLDARLYKGDWAACLDKSVVLQAIQDFKSAPAAYALDFGLDAKGQTLLVEVNDGHSLGSYGLHPLHYAKFLAARWAQMVGQRDWLA